MNEWMVLSFLLYLSPIQAGLFSVFIAAEVLSFPCDFGIRCLIVTKYGEFIVRTRAFEVQTVAVTS